MTAATPEAPASPRIGGLDSLRFALATWVVLFHSGGFPFPILENATSGFAYLVRGLYHNLWNGQAAVIAFFVVSGFCIHLPYRHRPVGLRTFFLRRYVRIFIPMFAALLLYWRAGVPLGIAQQGFLWSLICEEIYYLLYPLVKSARTRWGWAPVLGLSAVASLVVILSHRSVVNFDELGPTINWIAGYPCWLLGCVLAERITTARSIGRSIWLWRGSAVILGEAMMIFRNHLGGTLPLPLLLFSIFCFYWIEREIAYYRNHTPRPWLEAAGGGSYSLYLIHLGIVIVWMRRAHGSPQIAWLELMSLIAGITILFFVLVERPSHRLARWAAGAK